MGKLKGVEEGPACRLGHNLVNQLTVIVICCDLLSEEGPHGSETSRRLHLIRAAAKSISDELIRHECEPDRIISAANVPKPQMMS
jgi:hypothetical protein